MSLIIKLAWRNIWRNRKRSLLTIAAITFALLLTNFMRGQQIGTYAKNITLAVNVFSGYLQLQHKKFQDNPSLRKSIVYSDDLKQDLNSISEVKSFTPRIYSFGLLGYKDNSVGAALFGLDPDSEKTVTNLNTKVIEGEFLRDEAIWDIVVGHKMLKNLGAQIGDTIVILSNGFDGSMGNEKFRIGGISRMGTTEFDNASVFMHFKAAQHLLSMGRKVSVVAFSLNEPEQINIAKQRIDSLVNTKEYADQDLRVLDWGEVMPSFKQSIDFDNISGLIFMGLLILVVAFGIVNTILMSVTERFKEFGVMLAIGTHHSKLVYIVFWETVLLTVYGLIFGTILGFIANYLVYLNPIPLSVFMEGGDDLVADFGFEPYMYASIDTMIFVNNIIIISIASMLAFIYPAFKILKLEALKGLRYS
jgi:putative ABC transport system permease protein